MLGCGKLFARIAAERCFCAPLSATAAVTAMSHIVATCAKICGKVRLGCWGFCEELLGIPHSYGKFQEIWHLRAPARTGVARTGDAKQAMLLQLELPGRMQSGVGDTTLGLIGHELCSVSRSLLAVRMVRGKFIKM